MGRSNTYHNDWIWAHYSPNVRWSNLLKEYNETFRTSVSYPTFVSYMNRSLKLQQEFKYTKDQDNFLKETYPIYGAEKTTELFNERFGTNRTKSAIGHHCKDILQVSVSDKRKDDLKKEIGKRNYRARSIGSVSSGLFGTPAVKTENGWVRLDRISVDEYQDGKYVIHLDRDKENNNPENLMAISRYVHVLMTKYGFWSADPVSNKTALLWCQLDEALKNDGFTKTEREKWKRRNLKNVVLIKNSEGR